LKMECGKSVLSILSYQCLQYIHIKLKTNTKSKADSSSQVLKMECGKSVLTMIAFIHLGIGGEKTSEKIIFL